MGEEADALIEEGLLAEFNTAPDFVSWLRMGRFKSLRQKYVWTDKEGNKHKLSDINDYYLNNIVSFLQRELDELPCWDCNPVTDMITNTEYKEETLSAHIEFLKTEQEHRRLKRIADENIL